MRLLRALLLPLLVLVAASALTPTTAFAWSPFGGVDCSSVKTNQSAICQDRDKTEDPITGKNGLILKVVNVIAVISGAIAVIMIILAGLRFVTSGGSSDDVAGARRTIVYATVGLVVLVLARTLVGFVLGRL